MKTKVSSIGRDSSPKFGINPCAEIILRDRQFCNLSQVTIRSTDSKEDITSKVIIATAIGTIQSTLTDFTYLTDEWKKNCDEERLLGVGFTGVMDNALMNGSEGNEALEDALQLFRRTARKANEELASQLNINSAAAITCVKPAGNSTQLVGAHGSGLHEAYAKYYIRRNRGNKTDPVANALYMMGVHSEDEIYHPDSTWVFSYPMKAPEDAILRQDRSAIERLEHWLIYARNWCDHNPSVTINVRDDEWDEVGNWLYEHFDECIGVSFLPYDTGTYKQAPYEEISKEEYEELLNRTPQTIDWSILEAYESDDKTEGAQELACVSGACEI